MNHPCAAQVRGATIAGRVVSEIAATDARMRRRLGAGFAAPAWVDHFLARRAAVDPFIAACPAVAAARGLAALPRPPVPTGDADALLRALDAGAVPTREAHVSATVKAALDAVAGASPAGARAVAAWVWGCVQIKSSNRLQCARIRMF